jgi:hypothetical protein
MLHEVFGLAVAADSAGFHHPPKKPPTSQYTNGAVLGLRPFFAAFSFTIFSEYFLYFLNPR